MIVDKFGILDFEEILDLEKGDIFYECYSGYNLECKVETVPKINDSIMINDSEKRQLSFQAINTQNGEVIEYLQTEDFFMGPNLYSKPEYILFKDGKSYYKLIGSNKLQERVE